MQPTPQNALADCAACGERFNGRTNQTAYLGTDGRWRFVHRSVVTDWTEHRPAFRAGDVPRRDGQRDGVAGAADPSYGMLRDPAFARRD